MYMAPVQKPTDVPSPPAPTIPPTPGPPSPTPPIPPSLEALLYATCNVHSRSLRSKTASNDLNPATFQTNLPIAEYVDMDENDIVESFLTPPPGWTMDEFNELNLDAMSIDNLSEVDLTEVDLPPIFSLSEIYINQIEVPRTQGICGSCWAMTICGAVGDRFAMTYGVECPYPSTMWLLSDCYNSYFTEREICGSNDSTKPYKLNNGCYGGTVGRTLWWLAVYPEACLKLEKCWPYPELIAAAPIDAEGRPQPTSGLSALPDDACYGCRSATTDAERLLATFKLKIARSEELPQGTTPNAIELLNIQQAMKREIYCNGTILAGIKTTEEFKLWARTASYTQWFFKPTMPCSGTNWAGSQHALCITGWVDFEGDQYWEIRNTWGTSFGAGGYFYLAFSTMDNIDKWIGPEYLKISFTEPDYMEESEIDELVRNGIFTKTLGIKMEAESDDEDEYDWLLNRE